jgi:hypothetical protein
MGVCQLGSALFRHFKRHSRIWRHVQPGLFAPAKFAAAASIREKRCAKLRSAAGPILSAGRQAAKGGAGYPTNASDSDRQPERFQGMDDGNFVMAVNR